MEGRQGRKLHGIWMSCSLERKVRWITISTAAVVILSITAVMLIAGYGMKGFGDLLMGNSRSLAFWSAMDAESSSFQYYAGDRTPENREKYEMSCARTRSALKSLPFDYEEIGADRYGVTWSILNMYENYAAARDAFLEMEEGAPDYLDRLYTIYRVQGYLATHAGRLEQMTVQSGNERYEMQRPLFIIVPAVSILWGAAALLMVRWLNRSVQKNIVRPMVELAEDSRRIGENDFTGPDTCAEGSDEIASLVRAFCTMKASTRGYIEALTEKHRMEKQLDEVRLQMLKNQINPHFLFNTLNVIKWSSMISGAGNIADMITSLGILLESTMNRREEEVPLKEEIRVVKAWVEIKNWGLKNRIELVTDIQQELEEFKVIKFFLQPLVENAVLHGMGEATHGTIWVTAEPYGERVCVTVQDNGVGMEQGKLDEILKEMDENSKKRHVTGIGLTSIHELMKARYGPDYGLYIESRIGYGTKVFAVFPYRRGSETC